VLREAIKVAKTVGAGDVEAHALASLGPALLDLGRIDEGLEIVRKGLAMDLELEAIEEACRAYNNLVHSLYLGARYDEAAALGREALDYATRVGLLQRYGAPISGNVIAALVAAGRGDEAERVYADPRVPRGDPYRELRWLALPLQRGCYDEARALISHCVRETANADDVQFRAAALILAGESAGIDGRWDEARSVVADALRIAGRSDDQFYTPHGYAVGLRIEADRVGGGPRDTADVAAARDAADALSEQAQAFAARVASYGVLLPGSRGWLTTANAEHQRTWSRDQPADWEAVATVWDEVGQPYPAARALYRQAAALLRDGGDRATAADVARQALAVAGSLGAGPLATEIRQLARRGRLDLDLPDHAPRPALDVTPRELDVLRLLAAGRTNRQIGEALFISEKTASVHVTNLLRKLGVHSRVEAAAVAQNVGLVD